MPRPCRGSELLSAGRNPSRTLSGAVATLCARVACALAMAKQRKLPRRPAPEPANEVAAIRMSPEDGLLEALGEGRRRAGQQPARRRRQLAGVLPPVQAGLRVLAGAAAPEGALRAAVDALLHQGRQRRDVALRFGPVVAVAASPSAGHRHEPAVDLRLDELAAGRDVSGDDRQPAGQRLRYREADTLQSRWIHVDVAAV